MNSFSVIVTACNNATVLPNALRSVETALAFRRENADPTLTAGTAEIVVVDDGSTDATAEVLADATQGKDFYTLVRRPTPSSPSCARNAGVAAARGEILFFLDADDLYLPYHLHLCLREFADPAVGFVKTGVILDAPVHPDWQRRIEYSIVINLAVRRSCHDAIGGFLDYHLFTRDGSDFRHELDLFWKREDQFYMGLLTCRFRGVGVHKETVRNVRYPGNSFDRQYEKFCRPYGTYQEVKAPEDRLRLQLCEAIFEYRRALLAGQMPPSPR
jgi:glycosyltransferase involved in cell wall biosynthesis